MAQANEDKTEKSEKHSGQMTMISFVFLIVVLLFIIEIYEIFNDPNNLIAIGALGAFILVAAYVGTVLIRKLSISKMKEQKEAYNNIYRSEKASYLLLRKYFDQMDQKLGKIEKQSEVPYDDLIASQKALAKVQINRGKENTSVLMKANNRILDKLNTLQKTVDTMEKAEYAERDTIQLPNLPDNPDSSSIENTSVVSAGLSEEDKAVITNANQELLAKQQEILSNIKEMERNLRNEILDSTNKLNSLKQQMDRQKQVENENVQVQNNNLELEPITIEEDLSANNVAPDEQPIKNSSEMDLDQLLKDVGTDFITEGTMTSSLEEPDLPPIQDSINSEPIQSDLDLLPVQENETVEPDLSDLDLSPIEDSVNMEPIQPDVDLPSIKENETVEPDLSDLDLSPIEDSINMEPIQSDVDLSPIQENITVDSSLSDLDLPPIQDSVSIEPDLPEIDLPPIQDSVSIEPDLPEIDLPPIQDSVSIEPDLPEIDLPPIQDSTNTLTVSDLELQKDQDDSTKSIKRDSFHQSQQDLNMQSMLDGLVLQETSAIQPHDNSIQEKADTQSMLNDADYSSIVGHEETTIDSIIEEKNEISDNTLASGTSDPDLLTPDDIAALIDEAGFDFDDLDDTDSGVGAKKTNSVALEQETEEDYAPIVNELDLQPVKTDSKIPEIEQDQEINQIPQEELDQILGKMDQDMDKKKSAPDLSNPGHVMSADEIAALIANTDTLPKKETEKNNSATPELQDPGHVMSADEIAALIANL